MQSALLILISFVHDSKRSRTIKSILVTMRENRNFVLAYMMGFFSILGFHVTKSHSKIKYYLSF